LSGFAEARLAIRQARSRQAFYRSLAEHSAGPCRLLSRPGVEAVSAPAAGGSPLFNTVFAYADAELLEEALPGLEAEFRALGVSAWSVLVAGQDPAAARCLRAYGLGHSWTAAVMGGFLEQLDLASRRELALVEEPTWELVARCNDRAYGVPGKNGLSRLLTAIEDPHFHLYVAAEHGEPVCSVVSREQDADCYLWFVATVPEARHRGIAVELTRRCYRDAQARGCTTATGESTPEATRLYASIGGRTLGEQHVWVHRDPS
jgi:hypothetical protein